MEIRKILSWIALMLGEALIIAAFILFRGTMTDEVLVLNITVTTIIYGLFFIDVIVSWVDVNDNTQRRIGTIGVRWLFTWLYAILAAAAMITSYIVPNLSFTTQLLAQGALIFMLLLGFFATIRSSDRIGEIYQQESARRSGIIEMEKATSSLQNKMNEVSELPGFFITRINTLRENIRFISPANNQEAYQLDRLFTKTIIDIELAISNFKMNEKAIEAHLANCERIYHQRKRIHSH